MVLTERAVVHRLHREGVPISEIARRLRRSRTTIHKWLKEGETKKPAKRASKLDPFRAYIESRLERFELPATVLLEELRKRGYDGGITILRDLVAAIKARHVRRLVDRFETEPGRQAQVDWASCGTIWHRGRRRRLSLLVVVLGYSRTIWAEFVVSERRPVLMELLERAFTALGGVPRELLFDNLKAVVAQVRSEKRPTVIQPGFAAFAEHWGFEVVACPPYWPRAKGKVERGVAYIKKSFLEGRSFESLGDLNAQLRTWLAEVAQVRVHGTTRQRPVERLGEDQAAMLPVVDTAFPSATLAIRRADHDARISYRGVRYSVDPAILDRRRGRPVEVHLGTDGKLRLYDEGRLVGEHELQPPGSPPCDDPRHAEARRRLRQQPPGRRPRSGVCFDQRETEIPLPEAPLVALRSLSAYEEVAACRPS